MTVPTATVEDIVASLRTLLIEEIVEDDEVEVAVDDNLLAEGIIDSTGAVRLAIQIEALYSIVVGPEDFTIENFRSLRALAAFVLSKTASSG